MLAKILLPFRIERRIAAIAEEQIELDFVVTLAVKQELIVGRAIGADQFWILYTGRVLPFRCVISEQIAERVTLLEAIRGFPVGLDRFPKFVVETFVVSIAVLHDDRRNAIGMSGRQAIAHWCAVVLHIEGILGQPNLLGEF